MKLKDMDSGYLNNLKVKTSNGVVGYWKSQWDKGVWLSDGETERIYPQFVDGLRQCLEWETTEEPVNCHIKTDLEYIDMTSKE